LKFFYGRLDLGQIKGGKILVMIRIDIGIEDGIERSFRHWQKCFLAVLRKVIGGLVQINLTVFAPQMHFNEKDSH